MKISLAEQLKKLPQTPTEKWPEGVWFANALQHGSMSLEFFSPQGKDYQTPHEQDELYVVVEGKGQFQLENEIFSFAQGDVIFVAAGKEHRFLESTDDIKIWVIFWGPTGGEQ